MERLFQILAVILAGVAAYFLWKGNPDAGFVSVVFGAVSFFLSVRFQVKVRLDQRAAEREEEEKRREEEISESSLLNEMPAHEQIHDEKCITDKEKI
ncbi:MAG: hypothetical protein ABJA66_06990 [Actinomycetota bacterium]